MTLPRITQFGPRLKRARLEKGWSVRGLAELTGVDFRTIYLYEDEARSPNIEAAVRLAQKLDCSLDWLCGLDEPAAVQPLRCKAEIQPIGCEVDA
jgi:transcriptional regulator with XRE-family HTH domain